MQRATSQQGKKLPLLATKTTAKTATTKKPTSASSSSMRSFKSKLARPPGTQLRGVGGVAGRVANKTVTKPSSVTTLRPAAPSQADVSTVSSEVKSNTVSAADVTATITRHSSPPKEGEEREQGPTSSLAVVSAIGMGVVHSTPVPVGKGGRGIHSEERNKTITKKVHHTPPEFVDVTPIMCPDVVTTTSLQHKDRWACCRLSLSLSLPHLLTHSLSPTLTVLS